MATLKPMQVEAVTAEYFIYKIKRAKVEYAFYLVEHPYDWYLADDIIEFIEVDTPMDAVVAKLKIVLKQAGY